MAAAYMLWARTAWSSGGTFPLLITVEEARMMLGYMCCSDSKAEKHNKQQQHGIALLHECLRSEPLQRSVACG